MNLKGVCQIHNSAVCIESMDVLNKLGYKVKEQSIREGLSTVVHRGRMEEIHKSPLIIYDGGHNEQAIRNLKMTIDRYYKNRNRIYVVSILRRKDYSKILELLMEEEQATFLLTTGNSKERYVTGEELYEVAKKYKKEGQKIEVRTLENAIEQVLENAPQDAVTFVVGSLYIYGDVVKLIKNSTKD